MNGYSLTHALLPTGDRIMVESEIVREQRQPTEQSFPVSVSHGFWHCPAPLGE